MHSRLVIPRVHKINVYGLLVILIGCLSSWYDMELKEVAMETRNGVTVLERAARATHHAERGFLLNTRVFVSMFVHVICACSSGVSVE